MHYNADILIQEALSEGFSHAGRLNIEALVFMPEVREMCSADGCNSYGKNWTCPPACRSIEDAAREAAQYSFGLLVQTTGYMEDDFDYETMQETSIKHKASFEALVDKLRERYDKVLPMGAGACTICDQCTFLTPLADSPSARFLPWRRMACGSARFVSFPIFLITTEKAR